MKEVAEYIPLVAFLGKALGTHCEVVLHDVGNREHSIIAIANGHVSGRKIGGPLTDFTLKVLQKGTLRKDLYSVNYGGRGHSGKTFRSSSYFIRNREGRIIGILCLNYDVHTYFTARKILDRFILGDFSEEVSAREVTVPIQEHFHVDADSMMNSMIAKRLAPYNVSPSRLSVKERLQITGQLKEDGLFLLKVGITALAVHLSVSIPTIYRYLNRIRQE